MSDPVRHVAVVGCGIGGLMSALALQRYGIGVTVFERDAAPPAGVSPAESMRWVRKGVPQSLHPHFFMGRLRALLEDRYPAFVASLARAGVGENGFRDYVRADLADTVRTRPDEGKLRSLNARRTTFEMVLRDYVRACDGVEICDDARVTGLLFDAGARPVDARVDARAPPADAEARPVDGAARPVAVQGIEFERHGAVRHHVADAVIDASGRFSRLAEELQSAGVTMRLDQRDSGIWYFTRHYGLHPGQTYPAAAGLPGVQYDDFVVGALPADNGAFTVTFQIYREDRAVARALKDPDHFQAMCGAIGTTAPWVDETRSFATSRVYGFGRMDSFWRETVIERRPQVLGYFCVGDSCVRSNPKYGRGCTWTAVAAHHLADLLAAGLDAGSRVAAYEAILRREFRADWETMRAIDQSTEAAFEIAAGRPATPGERLAVRFRDLFGHALIDEPELFRDVWTGYHGFAGMQDWAKRPQNWLRIARTGLRRLAAGGAPDVRSMRPSHARLAGEA